MIRVSEEIFREVQPGEEKSQRGRERCAQIPHGLLQGVLQPLYKLRRLSLNVFEFFCSGERTDSRG